MADWSKLPYDIIRRITTYLLTIEDFLAFSSVCCWWRSVYLAKEWHPGTQLPVLMFSDNENSGIRSFLSLYRSKVSNLDLPELRHRRCWGSSLGWLVTIGNDLQIRLLNPFTRVSLNLPPKSSLDFCFGDFLNWYDIILRAYVFRNPCSSNAIADLVVVIIYGCMKQLAFCRPGYKRWRCLKDAIHGEFIDVTCVSDQIFALSFTGFLLRIDVDGQSLSIISRQDPPRDVALSLFMGGSERLSLVESSGELWMIYVNHRRLKSRVESTSFLVYALDFQKKQWIALSDLGCRTIFVGDNSCIAVCAASCESNSVYFIAPKREKEWPDRLTRVSVGVYSMTSGVSKPLCLSPEIQKSFSFPLWLMPSLK